MALRDGKRLIDYIKANGWEVLPLQLVVLRGADSDTWSPIKETLDKWDDTIVLLRDNGEVVFSVRGTADPGRTYSLKPMNPKGTMRLTDGQHKNGWVRGDHKGQNAFVQARPLLIQRDVDRDLNWKEEIMIAEANMGCNIHCTSKTPSDYLPENISGWSAGCIVVRSSKVFYSQLNPTFARSGLKFLTANITPGHTYTAWRAKWS